MALDRQDIERRDFPIGRRGYDPEAVDEHLAMLADELEEVRRSSAKGRAESIAAAASEQVRTIVQAAESSAAEIERQAEAEAREIRAEARAEADRARNEAETAAREHVRQVAEATAVMLQRIDAMESELGALMESLKTGANRLGADLTLLEGNMTDLREARGFEQEPPATPERPAARTAGRPSRPARPRPAAVPDPEPEAEDNPDEEGARLIALNMALNGTPREETERYLAENFKLADREGLLDDVYARAGS